MKLLAVIGTICALLIGLQIAYPDYSHRFRLTVEINTPTGPKTGSSVIEVVRVDDRWLPFTYGFHYNVRGEAAFVDLGASKHIVALLGHGLIVDRYPYMGSLAVRAFGGSGTSDDLWSGRVKMQGLAELKPPLIPTLAIFHDTSDLRSAELVYATELRSIQGGRTAPTVAVDRVAEVLGPGYTFSRAWVAIVPNGVWPLRLFGITGTSLAQGIESRITGLSTQRGPNQTRAPIAGQYRLSVSSNMLKRGLW